MTATRAVGEESDSTVAALAKLALSGARFHWIVRCWPERLRAKRTSVSLVRSHAAWVRTSGEGLSVSTASAQAMPCARRKENACPAAEG